MFLQLMAAIETQVVEALNLNPDPNHTAPDPNASSVSGGPTGIRTHVINCL